jgi:DNA-binding transcriptional LysR family regulator
MMGFQPLSIAAVVTLTSAVAPVLAQPNTGKNMSQTVPVFHGVVLKACREAGLAPHAAHEVDQLNMVLRMVAAGEGVALVPEAARKAYQDGVVYRPPRSAPKKLETAIAWRQGDSSATLAAFISTARRTLHQLRE